MIVHPHLLQGVYDRARKNIHLFQRGHRRKKVTANVVSLHDPELLEIIGIGIRTVVK